MLTAIPQSTFLVFKFLSGLNHFLLSATKRVNVQADLFDFNIAQTTGPCWHDAMLGGADLCGDGFFAFAVKPDGVCQVGATQFGKSFSIFAVTGRTLFFENDGAAFDDIRAY